MEEYTEKGAYAMTDLRQTFFESKCPEHANVRKFLDELRTKKERLAAVGVDISTKDYTSTILSSIPNSLSNSVASMLSAAMLLSHQQTTATSAAAGSTATSTSKDINPDTLIALISEEYDRQVARRRRNSQKAPRAARKPNEAMAFNPMRGKGRKPTGKGRRSATDKDKCWNCKKKGNFSRDCPDSPDKSKASGSAHVAAESDSDADGVFLFDAISIAGSRDGPNDVPEMQSVSGDSASNDAQGEASDRADWFTDSDKGTDWFSDVADDHEGARDCAQDYDGTGFDSAMGSEPVMSVDSQKSTSNTPKVKLYDSGATRHISPYRDDFVAFTPIPPKPFAAANGQKFYAMATGEIVINVPNGTDWTELRLTEVLYSPDVGYTLISIGWLDELGISAIFKDGSCTLRQANGKTIGQISKTSRGLYKVIHDLPEDSANTAVETVSLMQLHSRLGHIAPNSAKKLIQRGMVTGLRLDILKKNDPTFCESCVYAKATRKPVAKVREGERTKNFGDEVHTDLWGQSPVASISGKHYYVTFTDDATWYTHIYAIRKKSETFATYQTYEAMCKTQHNANIKVLHSDKGGEYLSNKFKAHLNAAGTKQKLTVHDTLQHNGVAERRNCTIVERIRAILHASGLPKTLWAEVAAHVVWLLNQTGTKALDGITPFEALTGKKPDLRGLHECGSKVWVRLEAGDKLGGHVAEGRWISFDPDSNGIWVYWPKKRSMTVERNVYSDETSALANNRREGEDYEFDDMSETIMQRNEPAAAPATVKAIPVSPPAGLPAAPPVPHSVPANAPEPPAAPEPAITADRPRRDRKPSQKVADILTGKLSALLVNEKLCYLPVSKCHPSLKQNLLRLRGRILMTG
jgi:gag-polypeptide of LTR copia-type/GAG-pre-integrase domain